MLNLALAQIELALRHANDSVSVLGNSFTSMAGNREVIRRVMLAQDNCDQSKEEKALKACVTVKQDQHGDNIEIF